jgi:hypothetical protein
MPMPMIIINRPVCTHESHQTLRSNRAAYVSATVPNGWQEDYDGSHFEMRLCRRCKSSLSDGTRRAVIDVTEVARVA